MMELVDRLQTDSIWHGSIRDKKKYETNPKLPAH